jgi:hypothetical protein
MAKNVVSGLAAALLFSFAAQAEVADFYGNWENAARDATGITHVAISPAGGNRVSVRVYGDCHPNECDWGVVPADSFTDGPRTGEVKAVSALIHYGFAHRRITLRVAPNGELAFEAQIQFVEGSGKHDFTTSGRLHHTNWAGPMSKASWEVPLNQNAGWGGGARGAALQKPQETCVRFDPKGVQLLHAGPGWNIVSGGTFVLHTDWNEKTARKALTTIKHFRFDQKCHTGTMEFWKTGNTIPAEKMPGVDCLQFGSTTAHVAKIGNGWRVVDGTITVADLNVRKDNAMAVLALIRAYRLERKCVIAWPNPAMTFWLSH